MCFTIPYGSLSLLLQGAGKEAEREVRSSILFGVAHALAYPHHGNRPIMKDVVAMLKELHHEVRSTDHHLSPGPTKTMALQAYLTACMDSHMIPLSLFRI